MYRVERMCSALGVSKSGYYKYRYSKAKQSTKMFKVLVRSVYFEHSGRYGIVKITRELHKRGIKCNKKRVARIMKSEGLKAVTAKKYRITTDSNHNRPVADNLLKQNFQVDAPNKVWLSDITYIPTGEGWLYLVVIMDLYSRMIISYAADKYMRAALITDAFIKAIIRRGSPENLIFHSDRGIQYTADLFISLLRKYNVNQSMSRKGNCYDNAPMESFFHILKSELVHQTKYRTRAQAERDIFSYIEQYYNRSRIHSSLNYNTPLEYEKIFT
jgi:putative transposase